MLFQTSLFAFGVLLLPTWTPQQATGQRLGPRSGLQPLPYVAPVELVDGTDDAELASILTVTLNDHSGGVAWVDYNNDYWPDLFIPNGFGFPHYLYRNDGDGTFTDVSSIIPKPNNNLEEAAAVFADADNDGDSDIFIAVDSQIPLGTTQGGPNLFYRNDGGSFLQGALPAGLVSASGRRSITAGFADYDRDGLVDLYCGQWARSVFRMEFSDRLFHNNGGLSFTDLAPSAGADGEGRNNLTFLWFDVNMDNWPDLYVGNVGEFSAGYVEPENHDVLYRNDANGLTFTDITGGGTTIGNDATAVMGNDVGDIDNDGDWDLYLTDNPVEGAAPFGNVLYQGNGTTLEDNSCDTAGVCLTKASWPCSFADFNRDGWVDLLVGTTFSSDPDALFVNLGNGTFVDSPQTPLSDNRARGGSQADFDGDGDVDYCLWRSSQNLRLIRNEGVDGNRYLSVKLIATTSNRDAIGATVRVTAGGVTQMRRVSGGDSAHSQQELILHFGLGDAAFCDVNVTWPGGTVQNFNAVGTDDLVFIDETTGIMTESLASVRAEWEGSDRALDVRVKSNFGGRTGFLLEEHGALTWDPETGLFRGRFSAEERPSELRLRSERGQVFRLSVD